MNAIRATQALNKRELEAAVAPSASWHADYRDTAYVYIGGLPLDLSEGDVVTIFSQFGTPTHLNMVRDRETGKSRGFAFLKYEDQRSCDLAVDNLGGAEVLGRILRVDHTRYKKRDDEDEDTYRIERLEADGERAANASMSRNGKRASDTESSDKEEERRQRHKRQRRQVLKDEGYEVSEGVRKERHRARLAIRDVGDEDEKREDDPMRDYVHRTSRIDDKERTIKTNDMSMRGPVSVRMIAKTTGMGDLVRVMWVARGLSDAVADTASEAQLSRSQRGIEMRSEKTNATGDGVHTVEMTIAAVFITAIVTMVNVISVAITAKTTVMKNPADHRDDHFSGCGELCPK